MELRHLDSFEFRVKPEPKLRPYKDAKEFLQAMKEHGPYIQLGCKNKSYHLPVAVDDQGIVCDNHNDWLYANILNEFWQDGTPCGILES